MHDWVCNGATGSRAPHANHLLCTFPSCHPSYLPANVSLTQQTCGVKRHSDDLYLGRIGEMRERRIRRPIKAYLRICFIRKTCMLHLVP